MFYNGLKIPLQSGILTGGKSRMALRIFKVIISIAYYFFIWPIYRYISKYRSQSCIILYYHSITQDERLRFIGQLDYLVKQTTPVPLDFRGPFRRNTRYSIVTIDDAYQSVIDRGVPELLKLKIPFTIFVPTGCLGKRPGWLEDPGHRDESDTVATKDALLAIPPEYVIFGSHTISHPHLPQLEENEAYHEINDSKSQLESLTHYGIKYLSFPFGDFSQEAVELCKKAGYRQVLTSTFEPAISPLDKYVKGRVCVNPSDWMIEFKLKLSGSYAWMPLASSLKKSIKNVVTSR